MPDWSWHWGSNSVHSRWAYWNLQLAQRGLTNQTGDDLRRLGTESLHFFHGVNPLGLVMLSNMYDAGAERSVNQLYHVWFEHDSPWDDALASTYGPPPGYVTGGPNDFYEDVQDADLTLVPPAFQPAQKSYLDENETARPGIFNNAIYSINEPAIYYNSAFIRLLANFVGTQAPVPVQLVSFEATALDVGVRLDWTAEREVDFERYEVQRATDTAPEWTEIGRVDGSAAGRLHLRRPRCRVGRALLPPTPRRCRRAVVPVEGAQCAPFVRGRGIAFRQNRHRAQPR